MRIYIHMFFKDVMCKCPKAWSPRQEGQMDFTLQDLQILCWHVFNDVIYSYEFMFFIDLSLLHSNSVHFCLLLSLWTFRAKHETIRKNLITICSSDALTRASWQECWVCLRYQRPLLNLDWCQSHPITFLVWRITQRCKRWWHTCADLTFGRHSTTGLDHENCPKASYVQRVMFEKRTVRVSEKRPTIYSVSYAWSSGSAGLLSTLKQEVLGTSLQVIKPSREQTWFRIKDLDIWASRIKHS